MAKDKSSKTPAGAEGDGSGVSATETQAPTKRRRGIFSFLRGGDKSKSSKNRAGKLHVELTSDAAGQNNNRNRSASFSESSKEQPTRKVKRHLSVSRSGKLKEVRNRPSLNELTKRFETQAQV